MAQNEDAFLIWKPNPAHPGATLFCLPFAGGSAAYFVPWRNAAGHRLDIVPVQLPGRGSRIAEPPFQRMEELVGALADALAPRLRRPYALMGHSMGAAVAVALAHELRRRDIALPVHLFVSGRRAPHLPARTAPLHALTDAALLEELRRMQGTPDAVLADPELLALMLPIVRADLRVVETAAPIAGDPLPVPITAFGGEADRVTRDELLAWREQGNGEFALHLFPGGHFFLQAARDQMLRIIADALAASPVPAAGALASAP